MVVAYLRAGLHSELDVTAGQHRMWRMGRCLGKTDECAMIYTHLIWWLVSHGEVASPHLADDHDPLQHSPMSPRGEWAEAFAQYDEQFQVTAHESACTAQVSEDAG
jgi:hypothetical protein